MNTTELKALAAKYQRAAEAADTLEALERTALKDVGFTADVQGSTRGVCAYVIADAADAMKAEIIEAAKQRCRAIIAEVEGMDA